MRTLVTGLLGFTLTAALAGCAPGSSRDGRGEVGTQETPTPTPPAVPECQMSGDPFAAPVIEADVSYLASDALGGRVPGTPGDLAARALVMQQFACANLLPMMPDGTYLQPFVNAQSGAATANVLGYLPGSDPVVADEIVVVSAHLDHLGMQSDGSVLLGANDNASGIGALLANARSFGLAETRPRRTIVFAAFASEESDDATEGSELYVANPPLGFPLSKTVYDVNFDMVGTYPFEQVVYAIGSMSGTPARPMLEDLDADFPLVLDIGEPGEGDSDFYPFCMDSVPYVFFWTSDDACYHRACDTVDRLDFASLSAIARLGGDLTKRIADSQSDLLAYRASADASALGCDL